MQINSITVYILITQTVIQTEGTESQQ